MISTRKFHRTIILIEVLTEDDEPYRPTSLADIVYDIDEGEASGQWLIQKSEELDGASMARLLLAQKSDPEFFRLDEYGNDLDDELEE